MTTTVSIFEYLDLSDGVSSTTKVGAVEDTISFGDGVLSGRSSGRFVDGVIWKETLTPKLKLKRTFTESMTFTEFTHWRTVYASFSDVFFILENLSKVQDNPCRDTLTLNDSFNGFKTKSGADKLQLTDGLSVRVLSAPVIPDSITLTDNIKVYYNDPWRFPS